MKNKNGFITFFVLWLGVNCLLLAMFLSLFSYMYSKQAFRYYDSVTETYLAETALCIGWQSIKQYQWRDIPTKKDIIMTDEYGVGSSADEMKIHIITDKNENSGNGAILVSAKNIQTDITKTNSILFDVISDNNTNKLHIKQLYF